MNEKNVMKIGGTIDSVYQEKRTVRYICSKERNAIWAIYAKVEIRNNSKDTMKYVVEKKRKNGHTHGVEDSESEGRTRNCTMLWHILKTATIRRRRERDGTRERAGEPDFMESGVKS